MTSKREIKNKQTAYAHNTKKKGKTPPLTLQVTFATTVARCTGMHTIYFLL